MYISDSFKNSYSEFPCKINLKSCKKAIKSDKGNIDKKQNLLATKSTIYSTHKSVTRNKCNNNSKMLDNGTSQKRSLILNMNDIKQNVFRKIEKREDFNSTPKILCKNV